MSTFPLFTSLRKGLLSRDLTAKTKENFIAEVKNIDESGSELIYALVRFYYIEETGTPLPGLPYEGKITDDNVQFNLDNFPNKLKQLLYKFIQLHVKNMEEEEQRSSEVNF
jgi:hypothetical protein